MPLPPVEGVPVARGVRVAAGIWQQVAKRRAELRRDQGELEATWILGIAAVFGFERRYLPRWIGPAAG